LIYWASGSGFNG